MKTLIIVIFFFGGHTISMNLPYCLLAVPDDALTQLITVSPKSTNYLHLLPPELHAHSVLPYLPIGSTGGALVALFGGKNVSNAQLHLRLANVRMADAKRLVKISRVSGCEPEVQKKQERIDMALNAIETDNDDELDYFYDKERRELALLVKNRPLGILEGSRETAGLLKAAVDKKLCQMEVQQLLFDKGCIKGTLMLSASALTTTGVWGMYKWFTRQQFYDCKDAYWNRIQGESYATDKPCNFTDTILYHGNTWACIDRVTTEMCNKDIQHQFFISFLPLITVAFIVAGTQGVLLLIKKMCRPRHLVSRETEQLVEAYAQAITQAEEGMLPSGEEI